MGTIFLSVVLYFGTKQLLETLNDLFFHETETEETTCRNRQTAQTGNLF